MADTHIAWVQPSMTHLPGVEAAREPDGGGIALLLGPLLSYLLASQNLVTFPSGSSIPLGSLEAKRGIMRELLGDMGGGLGPMFPPFHYVPCFVLRPQGGWSGWAHWKDIWWQI
jgi:hypothetical protein